MLNAVMIGSAIVIVTGILDDMFELSAKIKFIAQIIAAAVVIFYGGVQVEFINLPFMMAIRIWFSKYPDHFFMDCRHNKCD